MSDLSIPEKEGKRGTTSPYLNRLVAPLLASFNWTDQQVWRNIVDRQGIAVLCRETIIEKVSTLDWRIEPRDPSKRQELRSEIKYYEKLFAQNPVNRDNDFVSTTEWILGDALDLPFGAGVELVYSGDDPNKRLLYYVLLDGTTLLPTNHPEYPVIQRVPETPDKMTVFPRHSINRLFYSLDRRIRWRGWSVPPPVKIFLAINMINQGDNYYWKFLVDTPEVGILDLLDMDKQSAEEWLDAWKSLLQGVDPYKIPVLYEHTSPATFIPFSRSPHDIQFRDGLNRYDAIVAGGYGLSLSSLGFQVAASGGETLAGSVRGDRNDRNKGFGVAKKKMKAFRDRMLPGFLEFTWIDPDDEQTVAKGRAMLSLSTATAGLISSQVISPKEARQILIASGLPGVSLPEDIPEDEIVQQLLGGSSGKFNGQLTANQPPSTGGQGEVRASMVDKEFDRAISDSLMYGEISPLIFYSDFIIPELLQIFENSFEAEKSKKPFLSKSRFKKFDTLSTDFQGFVLNELSTISNNFESLIEKTKLDKEEDSIDNIRELLISEISASFSERVVEYINQKLMEI